MDGPNELTSGSSEAKSVFEQRARYDSPANIFTIETLTSFCGRGIAQKLVSVCLENGAAKGYRRAITMATNRTSQRVFQKLGFNELFSVSYKDYTFDGNRVFASIEPDDRTALLERVL